MTSCQRLASLWKQPSWTGLTADEQLPGGCLRIGYADLRNRGRLMSKLTREEKQGILESPPRGTFTLLLIFAVLFLAGWLLLYFGRYMVLGPVS